MEHRQLPDRRAKQLGEAWQRIAALENTVADRDAQLAQMKGSGSKTANKLKSEVTSLHEQLAHAFEVTTKANEYITVLEDTVQARKAELTLAKQNIAILTNQKSSVESENAQQAAAETEDLRKKLDESKESEANLRKELKTVEHSLGSSRSYSGLLRSQLDRDQNTIEVLRSELSRYDAKASEYKAPLSKSKWKQADSTKTAKVKESEKLKAELPGEKKRKLEGEASLGADGKRCRKGNPIAVELMGESDAVGRDAAD